MRILFSTFFVSILIFLACSGDDDRYELGIDDFYGVWANENCELVKTGLYELMFERIDGEIYSSIRKFSEFENKLIIDTRGFARFDTLSKIAAIEAKDLVSDDSSVIVKASGNEFELKRYECEVTRYHDKFVISHDGRIIEELIAGDNKLRILFPSGNWQTLELVERIEVTRPYAVIKATGSHLGTCLQQWQLGTTFQDNGSGIANAVEIHTNRHSFVFNFDTREGGRMAYCRAARIRSNNNGTVFAQNIRLMSNPGNFTAWMETDNLELALSELAIEDSLFDPNMCVYAADGIYWSVKDYDDSTVTVNGCGQDYVIRRPDETSDTILEWFEFAEY